MRLFVLRTRKGPTSASRVDKSMGPPDHFEVIAHSIVSALHISRHIRPDVQFHIALEGSPDPPKIVRLDSRAHDYLRGFDENSIASVVKKALAPSAGIGKDTWFEVEKGLHVARMSFEKLVRDLADSWPVYLLSKKGTDIRDTELPETGCYLFTDHISMQKKTHHLLERLGVRKISLGPSVLFASHCITLVQNELDRRERVSWGGKA